MSMGNIIIHNSNLSKKFFPLESVSRIAFDNWYYKVDEEGLRYSTLVISCGFETIVISDKKNYVKADNLSETFNLKLYYVKDENGNIIFTERYIAHE